MYNNYYMLLQRVLRCELNHSSDSLFQFYALNTCPVRAIFRFRHRRTHFLSPNTLHCSLLRAFAHCFDVSFVQLPFSLFEQFAFPRYSFNNITPSSLLPPLTLPRTCMAQLIFLLFFPLYQHPTSWHILKLMSVWSFSKDKIKINFCSTLHW